MGQTAQPDGSGSIRRDDSTGQYSPAVAAAAHTPGSQFGNTGQQQSSQLNLGQPGGQSGQQPNHPGPADQQQHGGGRHSGPEYDTPTGHTGPGEPDPRAAEHRAAPGRSDAGQTENRSVDLRV
jgi:hypothetical protein